jgi:peroxiredoxin
VTAAADTPARAEPRPPRPFVAGKVGATLLCLYIFGVTARIEGCYHPVATVRDELQGAGPAVGAAFPPFALDDVSGTHVSLEDLRGAPSVLIFVPSLDWSPPTKARVLELADTFADRRDVRVAVMMTQEQATARALSFVRERRTPFYYLVDDKGVTEQLGLAVKTPAGDLAAQSATFVLDRNGTVTLRDVRKDPRTWLAASAVADAVTSRGTAGASGADRAP